MAKAETPPHVEKVEIGLPGAQGDQESSRSRVGAWAPVYVKLKAGPDGNLRDHFKIRVETTDVENTPYHYETPVPALTPNQDYFAVSYVRPGTAAGDFTVSLLTADGQAVFGAAPTTLPSDPSMLEPGDALFVTLGARPAAIVGEDALSDKKSPVHFAFIDDIYHLPDRWHGYEAADVVILATGSEEFVKSLLEDESSAQRRKALAEWVRRGGKLIVSVGSKRQLAAEVLERMPLPDADKMPLIDCRVEGAVTCPHASNLAHWLAPDGHVPDPANAELTRLTPGQGVTVLVSESVKDDRTECPLVVESACGLGRVWLIGLDLDGPPFSTWAEGRKAMWAKIQSEFTPKDVVSPPTQNANPNQNPFQNMPGGVPPGGVQPGGMPPPGAVPPGMPTEEAPSLLAELERTLENFENVPVVSFGWVALFILIYIVIVGPLDYLLLTRVFKKPELTWVTFPVIVLTLSVLVYVVAYSMKGDELRINKIDLVEYDLGEPRQAYGTAWFTLFSPRIQNYTIGLEPSAPGWAAPPPADATSHAVTLSGLSNPDQSERAGSTSLFRKPYAYAEDASGLDRVPIPVWSTRSFQASWRAAVDPDRPPLEADLSRDPKARDRLVGKIVNRLPVGLRNVSIFYRGAYFTPPGGAGLGPNEEFDVKKLWDNNAAGRNAPDWAGDNQALAAPSASGPSFGNPDQQFNSGPGYSPVSYKQPYQLMKDLMFHAKASASGMNNSGLRPFDESWRLNEKRVSTVVQPDGKLFRDEVILVARTADQSDRADVVAKDPGSATRLWIDRLPDGKSPPELNGYLQQQTYVRIYIPVKPPDDKARQP